MSTNIDIYQGCECEIFIIICIPLLYCTISLTIVILYLMDWIVIKVWYQHTFVKRYFISFWYEVNFFLSQKIGNHNFNFNSIYDPCVGGGNVKQRYFIIYCNSGINYIIILRSLCNYKLVTNSSLPYTIC